MSILAWIVLGLIAGFIASKIVNHRGLRLVVDMILGIAGAVLGGWLVARLGGSRISEFNLYRIPIEIGAR